MPEEKMTPQEDERQIRAEAKLISDFYAGRLNAKGREFVRLMMMQANQDCYLRSTNDSVVEQQATAAPRPAIVAVEGVKSADEIDRYMDGLLRFSRKVLEKPDGMRNAIFLSHSQHEALRVRTSLG